MSPSRSPSGPTYTQLGSVPPRPGVWGQWQPGAPGESQPTSAPVSASGPAGQPGTQHPQELLSSEMLQMLGQSEPASFEDLSMFNSFPE